MDLNTRIRDELLFSNREYGTIALSFLSGKNIVSVGDFISSHYDNVKSLFSSKEQYEAFVAILKYKYLNEELSIGFILDKKYLSSSDYEEQLCDDLKILGFDKRAYLNIIQRLREEFNEDSIFRVIDVIYRMSECRDYIKSFYIEYYAVKYISIDTLSANNLRLLEQEICTIEKSFNALNIKTKLSDEPLMWAISKPSEYGPAIKIFSLNSLGIYTVEDFIRYDFSKITDWQKLKMFEGVINLFPAIQKMLKYKYLGHPLGLEEEFSKVYTDEETLDSELSELLPKLGISAEYSCTYAVMAFRQNSAPTLIDVIGVLYERRDEALKNFYIEYYYTHILGMSKSLKLEELKNMRRRLLQISAYYELVISKVNEELGNTQNPKKPRLN